MRVQSFKGASRRGGFERVIRQGKFAVKGALALYVLPNELPFSRFGVSVALKVGSPVYRNRIKRWAREIIRMLKNDINGGLDFVLMVRKDAINNFEEFRSCLLFLLKNRGVIRNYPPAWSYPKAKARTDL